MANFEYQQNIETYLDQKIHQYNDFRKQRIDPYLPDIKGKTFLEIGYGAGSEFGGVFMSLFYRDGAARPVYGIDVVHPFSKKLNQRTIDFWKSAKEKYNLIQDPVDHYWEEHIPPIIKIHMNSENMYLKNELVDVIYSSAVLEHITRPDLALKEMYRILKPGGLAAHSWNPFTSLTMGGHDIGIPYYYPWAHLRLKKEDHIQKLKEVFSNDTLRSTASVQEHTLTLDYLSDRTIESIYEGACHDLNKIRIDDMCKMAESAGFTILDQYVSYINKNDIHLLTDEIKKELSQYSMKELLCSSHTLVLKKNM
jgi:ubiquinone/menaquinone biosynthesis C-methylase UbiE